MLRLARTSAGLTLEQIGATLGYSASTLSRLENGLRPIHGITELHRLADAYDVPAEWLGLANPPERADGSSLTAKPDTGGETVHRRGFIAGTAGLTVVAATGAAPAVHAAATDTIEDVLFGRVTAEPLPTQQIVAQIAAAGADYRATRYRRLARRLPRLLAQANANHAAANDQNRATAGSHLGQAYSLATLLLLKFHDGLAATTADRAVQAAAASGSLFAVAESQRLVTTVLRRTQHRDAAQRLVLAAAEQLRAGGLRTVEETRLYGRLLATAGYTAAIRDDRDTAWTLLNEAATRTGVDGFLPIDIAVYRISVANKLGDYGAAVDHARKVNPSVIVAPERRARYWQDTAMALHGRGRPDAAFTVLRAAERDVPEEVRYRPWARQLTHDLLKSGSGNRLSNLREFATRIGIS